MTTFYEPNLKIIKQERTSFTIISNDSTSFARDTELSVIASAILYKVMSLPKDWHFTKSGFQKIMKIGKTSLESHLKELEQLNYLVKERIRDKLGRFLRIDYLFFECREDCLEYKKKQSEASKS